jgi:hypothetical protein
LHSILEEALAFGARSRAIVERGERPPRHAVLQDREIASQATANVSRGFSEARIIPIEVLARKPAQASRALSVIPHNNHIEPNVGKPLRVSLDDIARQARPTPLHPQLGAHHHG